LTPQQILNEYSRMYPEAWDNYDLLIHALNPNRNWPDWLFAPVAAAYAVVSGGGINRVPLDRMPHVATVAALAAWRPAKQIFRFDPDLRNALFETEFEADLSDDIFYRLPSWCVWIEVNALEIDGFFVHLEVDTNDGRKELRLLIAMGEHLQPLVVHLGRGGIAEGLERSKNEALAQATFGHPEAVEPEFWPS
jgi:hypothetical protein